MNRFKIKTSDIILENYEIGRGKIIISDLYNGSFSYYWGSMGDGIEEFLKSINSDYFANKLCVNQFVFSGKQTAKEIRRYIREEMKYDCLDMEYKEEKEFIQIIKDMVSTEPWHFLQNDFSKEYKFLAKLHKQIQKHLTK